MGTTGNPLFVDLLKAAHTSDWQRLTRIADKLLKDKDRSTDGIATHCKIVGLIQLSQFEEALALIQKSTKFSLDVTFEKAYCLYRLNRTNEALDLLDTVTDPDDRIKELKAQVLYRLEQYEDCYHLYRDVIKNSQDDYEEERETNLSAVIAGLHLTESSLAKQVPKVSESTYELTYNAACSLIAKKDYKTALKALVTAEERCRKALEEDELTEEDIQAEAAIIMVQRAYVLQLLGQSDEAAKLYNQVLKNRPSDIGLSAVASNNVVVINKDQNMFDSKKKMKVATADGLEHKLTTQQRRVIAVNQALLYLNTNQGDACKKQIHMLQEKHDGDAEPVLIHAALLCKEKNVSKAVEILEEFALLNADTSVNIKLVLVQLLLTQGHVSQACEILESLEEMCYTPGVVSARVILYLSLEDRDSAAKVFEVSINWYKKNRPQSPELITLLRECANFHLRNGNPNLAVQYLEELRQMKGKDMRLLAQLITAYAEFDPDKARAISKGLPSIAELSKNIDVDALESTTWTAGSKHLKKGGKAEPSPALPKSGAGSDAFLVAQKKKKKKKGKLPKNYDPNEKPDPERWLPRRERSTYKKRKTDRDRRGGASAIGKGTQGATSGADMDVSNKPSVVSPVSPVMGASTSGAIPKQAAYEAATETQQGPRQQRPQAQQQRKKKKKAGSKW